MNPRDKYHNVDKQHRHLIMNIHYTCSWYSQRHRTQSYNENIAGRSFRTTVPAVTITLQYKDFDAHSMALGLGLGSVGLVGLGLM